MKLLDIMNQVPPVVSAQKSPLVKENINRQSPVTYYEVKDRVTLSPKAKVMSHNITPVLMDDTVPSILSYEIRKPYMIPVLPKISTHLPLTNRKT